MKSILMGSLLIAASLLCTTPARAWNCSNPLASRVDVGSTKPVGSSAGDGDGQYYIGKDAQNPNDYYVCQVPKPPTTPPATPTTSNSSSSASSSSTSNSSSVSGSNSSATGGNASATGGKSTSTSGVSNSGNSSSNSGVKNSGNSTNTNTNTANGGAGGSASANATGGAGGTASSSSSNNSTGSGNSTEVNSTYNQVHQTSTALAPDVAVTAPCTKGMSAAAQSPFFGASLGGSKVDRGCDARETARYFATLLHNRVAAAIILCDTPAAKHAHLTQEQCLASIPEPTPVIIQAPVAAPVPVPPTSVTVPVTITLPAVEAAPEPPVVVQKPAVVKHTYTPFSFPYVGQYLLVEGPIELVCDKVVELVKAGVPRDHIHASGSEKYHGVHVFVVN